MSSVKSWTSGGGWCTGFAASATCATVSATLPGHAAALGGVLLDGALPCQAVVGDGLVGVGVGVGVADAVTPAAPHMLGADHAPLALAQMPSVASCNASMKVAGFGPPASTIGVGQERTISVKAASSPE
jgi:hypothetical protein